MAYRVTSNDTISLFFLTAQSTAVIGICFTAKHDSNKAD